MLCESRRPSIEYASSVDPISRFYRFRCRTLTEILTRVVRIDTRVQRHTLSLSDDFPPPPFQALERQLVDRSRQLAASQAEISDLGALQSAAAVAAAAARDSEMMKLRKALEAQSGELLASQGTAQGLTLRLVELQGVVDRKEGVLRASQVTAEGLVAQYAQLAEMLASQAQAVHGAAELSVQLSTASEARSAAETALQVSEEGSAAAEAQHAQHLSELMAALADAELSRCGQKRCRAAKLELLAAFFAHFPFITPYDTSLLSMGSFSGLIFPPDSRIDSSPKTVNIEPVRPHLCTFLRYTAHHSSPSLCKGLG